MSDMPAYVRGLPRRALSQAVGVAARARLPGAIRTPLLSLYARAFGANLDEAACPISDYRTMLDFFTRKLRDGARTWPEDPLDIAAPADGKVNMAGEIRGERALQAKGVHYDLVDFLNDAPYAQELDGGSFLTTYLAPGDYHRFHWPFDARIDRIEHVPGDLWPVHPGAVKSVRRLFVRNERVVVSGRLTNGALFAFVPVGALNVGSIRLTVHPLRTNTRGPADPRRWTFEEGIPIRRGGEAGWFEMGSAIVVLIAKEGGRFETLPSGRGLRVGQTVGRLAP